MGHLMPVTVGAVLLRSPGILPGTMVLGCVAGQFLAVPVPRGGVSRPQSVLSMRTQGSSSAFTQIGSQIPEERRGVIPRATSHCLCYVVLGTCWQTMELSCR